MANVKVYSTKTCPWCEKAKQFLKEKGVAFDGLDVGSDEKARNEMFEKSGQLGVPVIEIGETVIVGFDADAMTTALKEAQLL